MAEQKKQEQDTNQLLKVRREKLAELQANGKDPFQITKFNQTHHSLEVKEIYEAHEAELLKDHKEPEVEGLDEEQKKEVRELVMVGLEQIKEGKTIDFNTVCDRLEKKYRDEAISN